MSDTEGMVRLMDHAAEKLKYATNLLHKRDYHGTIEFQSLEYCATAMAYGRAILEMVAASVAPEGSTIAQRVREGYSEWAEATNDTPFSDGELDAIARFITSGAS